MPKRRSAGRQGREDVRAALRTLAREVSALKERVGELRLQVGPRPVEKQWYSTAELAGAMGVSQHTIQERWCNKGRIEAEKDSGSGRWRIPAGEYRRLTAGGSLRPVRKVTP